MSDARIAFSFAAISLVAWSGASAFASHVVKPNIVIIFIDDLGYSDVGPFGATSQSTPNIDRMANEGMKLTSFYAATVCSASRAQLMTGCYQARVSVPGVFHPSDGNGLHPAEVTIAERLKEKGYATICIGKWHLGDQPTFLPTRQGFDHYFGIPYSNDMQIRPAQGGAAVVPLLRDNTVQELLTEDQQSPLVERYTNESISFINQNKSQPFFLYLPHNAVHTPIHPGAAFQGKSNNGRFGDWVEEVDWSVGQILDTLRQNQLDAKTLVVFTSDNGPWLVKGSDGGSADPLRGGKTTTWEGGMRVPAIAWWPGTIAASSVSDADVGTIDILPTAVALAGGTVPATPVIDGRDISPLLSGTSTQSPREAHFYFNNYELQAVRRGPWKLAITSQPDAFGNGVATDAMVNPRPYNLSTEIGEITNVAASNPEIVASLQTLADNINAEIGGTTPTARRPAGTVANATPLFPIFQLPTPVVNGPAAQNVTARPLINWDSITDVASYDVWISSKTNNTAIIRQSVTSLSYTPAADMELGEYRVWIQGIYSDGKRTRWSAAKNFTVAPRPTLTAPRGTITTSTPTVTWTTVAGATRYDVCVSHISTGKSPFLRTLNVTGTQSKIDTPLPLGIYHVWVQPINSASFRGNWSLLSRFMVTTPPTLTAPLNTTTNGTPTFSWAAVPGANRYDLWVRNLTTGQDQVIRERNLTSNNFTPITPLPPANYIWWVQAAGADGTSSKWSAGGKLVVNN